MKKRLTEKQIIGFLREAEAGVAVKELCRRHGFSDASFYIWRQKFGGIDGPHAKHLRALEVENAKFKKVLPGASLGNEALKVVRCHAFFARQRGADGERRAGQLSSQPCVVQPPHMRRYLSSAARMVLTVRLGCDWAASRFIAASAHASLRDTGWARSCTACVGGPVSSCR